MTMLRMVAHCRPEPLAAMGDHSQHRSEEHTSELQSPDQLVCRLLLEKKNVQNQNADVLITESPEFRHDCDAGRLLQASEIRSMLIHCVMGLARALEVRRSAYITEQLF